MTHFVIWERLPSEQLQYRLIACVRHNSQQADHIRHLEIHRQQSLIVFSDFIGLHRWDFLLEEQPVWVCLILQVSDRISISAVASYAIVDDLVVPLYPETPDNPFPKRRICAPLATDAKNQSVLQGTVSTNLASGSVTLHTSSAVKLEMMTLSGSTLFNLLSLPKWPGIEHTFVIARPIETGSGTFRILLNTRSSSTYHVMPAAAERTATT
ncbi:hypothetical protein B0T14DRAFT_606795 [Immersiella caudata]|uniref:Uncharacterized protein n=1 Tax=Immersiella caudata TaxID=314043 RepID=A0AA40BUV7_9PEZI|nr:hypothetical protein B0T14DRAFT_606795 [Immersiella caudata]